MTTLYRELKEEINLDLDIKPKLIDTIIYKNQFVDIYTVDLPNLVTNFKLQKEEVSNIKWVDKNEFQKMINDNKIVASVLNRFEQIKNRLNLNW